MRASLRALICTLGLIGLQTGRAESADVVVGYITSLTGSTASIGIPYQKGMEAARAKLEARGIKVIVLDDKSDPSTAVQDARKLIDVDKVDVLIGTAGLPSTAAMAPIIQEAKVPLIVTSTLAVPGEKGSWMVTVPQPVPLMISADVEDMKRNGVKTVGYIGFSDAWGDIVHDALAKLADPVGIKVVTDERYSRTDTSVTGQALKIMAAHPDAIFSGGSGTAGALPHIAVRDRGFSGRMYSTHAIINKDFIRVGGPGVEGIIAPTGPIVVVDQLADDNPIKKAGLEFRAAYQKANGEIPSDAFSGYAYDACLILADAVRRMPQGISPGTPEYRAALRDAIASTKDLVGTHAVYNFKPSERYGVDERSRVLVKLDHGEWKLVP